MKRTFFFALAVLAAAAAVAENRMALWPEGKMPDRQAVQTNAPYMVWHAPKELKSKAILIAVSGGGYKRCSIDGFEVDPIRDYFLDRGVTVVTMKYRTPRPDGIPFHQTAWQDAQRTVRLVRREARRRGLDPENIGFTGCSAGGHLTLLVATSSQTPAYAPVDEVDAEPCHVNWAIPVYAAYALSDVMDSSSPNLKNRGNDLSVPLSPYLKFDAKTCPMCFFCGDADWWTMHSVRVYHKLRTMDIPAELHTFVKEQHCFMRDPKPGTNAANWKDIVWGWIVRMEIADGFGI